jgi:hypothetical protein
VDDDDFVALSHKGLYVARRGLRDGTAHLDDDQAHVR